MLAEYRKYFSFEDSWSQSDGQAYSSHRCDFHTSIFFLLKGSGFFKIPPPSGKYCSETCKQNPTCIRKRVVKLFSISQTSENTISGFLLQVHTRLPITDNFPAGESGVLTNQSRIILACSPKQLVCTHVTLVPPGGKVPVGQSKGLIASEALKAKGMTSHLMHVIRYNKKMYKAKTDMGLDQIQNKIKRN